MCPRLVRYYGPDYDNLKHGHVYQVHCLYSHGFMLIDDHHEQAYVYAGNCEVLEGKIYFFQVILSSVFRPLLHTKCRIQRNRL